MEVRRISLLSMANRMDRKSGVALCDIIVLLLGIGRIRDHPSNVEHGEKIAKKVIYYL